MQALGDYLQHQQLNVDAVLKALYANSEYGSKSLSSPSLNSKMAELEAAINVAGTKISETEAREGDAESLGLRNVRKNWSR